MKQNKQIRYFYAFEIGVDSKIGANKIEIQNTTAERIIREIREYFASHFELIKRIRVRSIARANNGIIPHYFFIETTEQIEPWVFNLFREAANSELSNVVIYDSLTYFNYENDTVYIRYPGTKRLTRAKRKEIREMILGNECTLLERLCFRPKFVESVYTSLEDGVMPDFIASSIFRSVNKEVQQWRERVAASRDPVLCDHDKVTYVPEIVHHSGNGLPALAVDSYELRPETGRDSYTLWNGAVSMVTDVDRGRAGFICVDELKTVDVEETHEVLISIAPIEKDVLSAMIPTLRDSWLRLRSLTFSDEKLRHTVKSTSTITKRAEGVTLGHTGLLGRMGRYIQACMVGMMRTFKERPCYEVVNVVMNYAGVHVVMHAVGYTHVISLLDYERTFADDYQPSDACRELDPVFEYFHEKYRDEMLDGTKTNKDGVEIVSVYEDTTYRWWFVAPCSTVTNTIVKK